MRGATFKVRIRTNHYSRKEAITPTRRRAKFYSDRSAYSRHSFFCWSILEHIADAVIYADKTGSIRRWNRAATELCGYGPAEASGCINFHFGVESRSSRLRPYSPRAVLMPLAAFFAKEGVCLPSRSREGY
jgi:PAS domain-containing protein